MKKIIISTIAILLILSGVFGASTVQGAVEDYFRAAADEDLSAYISSMDMSDKDSDGVLNTKEYVQEVWSKYDTDEYKLTNFDYVVHEDGLSALATFHIFAKVSGAESEEQDLDYVSLVNKVGGEWKVSFALPLGMYDELVQETHTLVIYDDMIKSRQEFISKNSTGEVEVYFDDAPMGDLTSEINRQEAKCSTDEYCISNNLGSGCSNGLCKNNSHSSNPVERELTDTFNGLCAGPVFAIFTPIAFLAIFRRKK